MIRKILILIVALGISLSAADSFIKLDGKLHKLDNSYLKTESGELVHLDPKTEVIPLNKAEEHTKALLAESHRLLSIDIDALILNTAPRDELIENVRAHRETITRLTKTLNVLKSSTTVAAGVYTTIMGQIVRTGMIVVTSTSVTLVSAPMIGTAITVAGISLTAYGVSQLYKALNPKEI